MAPEPSREALLFAVQCLRAKLAEKDRQIERLEASVKNLEIQVKNLDRVNESWVAHMEQGAAEFLSGLEVKT